MQRRILCDERIERAGAHEVFQHALVDDRRRLLAVGTRRLRRGRHQAHRKIHEALVGAVLFALLHNRVGGAFADALHARQAIDDRAFVLHGRKTRKGHVDIRQPHLEPHRVRLGHKARQLVKVTDFRRNLGAHELGGEVRLQVARLVGDPRVADGMRLVERIRRKRLPVFPDLVDQRTRRLLVLPLVDAEILVLQAALLELREQLLHEVEVLLAHRLAERVGHAAREAAQKPRKKHHLFLVHRDAVGVLQVRLHERMVVGDRFAPLLAGDEGRDVRERSRTVQGVHGDQVFQTVRLKLHQILLHAVRFELEKTGRRAAPEDFVRLLVVHGNVVRIDVDAAELLDQRHAFLFDRERLEAEEVHLQEADRLHEVSVVLGREEFFVGIRRGHHGQRVNERIARDDYAAGVHARLPDAAFETRRALHQLVDDGIGRIERPFQLGTFLARLDKGDLGRVGHEGGEFVRVGQRVLHHAPDILDGGLRGHLPERDDMRDMVLSVGVDNILQHLGATGVVEIDVDIRHGDAVGVQETFEQEIELERIDVRDAERVGDGAARRRTAARSHPYAELAARGIDVVLHDEEVAGESHFANGLQLEVHALLRLRWQRIAPAALGARVREIREVVGLQLNAQHLVVATELVVPRELLFQVVLRELLGVGVFRAELGGDAELRHDRRRIELVLLDALRDFQRVAQHLRMLRKYLRHLLKRLEPFLSGVDETSALGGFIVIVDLRRIAHLLAGRKRQ